MVLSVEDLRQILNAFGVGVDVVINENKVFNERFSLLNWGIILESEKVFPELKGQIKNALRAFNYSLEEWWKIVKISPIGSKIWEIGVEEIIHKAYCFQDWERIVMWLGFALRTSPFFDMALHGLFKTASDEQLVIVANKDDYTDVIYNLSLQFLDRCNFDLLVWVKLIKKNLKFGIRDFILNKIKKIVKTKDLQYLVGNFWRLYREYKDSQIESLIFVINVIGEESLSRKLEEKDLDWMLPMLKLKDPFGELNILAWEKYSDILSTVALASSVKEDFVKLAIKEGRGRMFFVKIKEILFSIQKSSSSGELSFRLLFFLYREGFYGKGENLINRLLESLDKDPAINKFLNDNKDAIKYADRQKRREVKYKYYLYLLKIAVSRKIDDDIEAIVNKMVYKEFEGYHINNMIETLAILPKNSKERSRIIKEIEDKVG